MDGTGALGERRTADGQYGPVQLLYVDDDETATRAVEDTLGAADTPIELTAVGSASAALELLSEQELDCIVSEYALPNRDGIALLGEVRERAPDLPFVLFTDDGDEATASEAISVGVTEYLRKTPLAEQTRALLRRVVAAVTEHDERAAILDRMTDAFFALDESWRFTYLNAWGREIIERATDGELAGEELLGRNIWHVVPSAIGTEFYEQYHRAMTDQRAVSFEAYYDEMDTWFGVQAYPSPTGLSVYFRDVTERRAREATIERREQALRDMYRTISRKETSFEEKVASLLSIGTSLLGTSCGALSHVDDEEYVFDVVDDPTGTTAAGDRVPLETTNCERVIVDAETLVLADVPEQAPELAGRGWGAGQAIDCYLGTPVRVDGTVDGTFCFYDTDPRTESFDDWEVTLVELMGNWVSYERERQRRQAELDRERTRLADFASFVSHDLRNPLNLAVGHLGLIAEEYEGDPEHVEAVESALDRMDRLIDDVLALARSGEQVVEPAWVDGRSVVHSAWSTTGTAEATLDVEESFEVEGDDARLQRLFENLFRNAVEHGSTSDPTQSDDAVEDSTQDDGSELTVRVGPLEAADGIYVADDGTGIAPDRREQVFERGYTTSSSGTGLGLRIVREIVQAHDGEIVVTDSRSGGARFELRGLAVGDG